MFPRKEGEDRKRRLSLAIYEWYHKIFSDLTEEKIAAFDEPDTELHYIKLAKCG